MVDCPLHPAAWRGVVVHRRPAGRRLTTDMARATLQSSGPLSGPVGGPHRPCGEVDTLLLRGIMMWGKRGAIVPHSCPTRRLAQLVWTWRHCP